MPKKSSLFSADGNVVGVYNGDTPISKIFLGEREMYPNCQPMLQEMVYWTQVTNEAPIAESDPGVHETIDNYTQMILDKENPDQDDESFTP